MVMMGSRRRAAPRRSSGQFVRKLGVHVRSSAGCAGSSRGGSRATACGGGCEGLDGFAPPRPLASLAGGTAQGQPIKRLPHAVGARPDQQNSSRRHGCIAEA